MKMIKNWKKQFGCFLFLFITVNYCYSQYSLSLQYLRGEMLPHSEYTQPLKAMVDGVQIDALWKLRMDQSSKLTSSSNAAYCPKIGGSLIFINNGLSVSGYQLGVGVTMGAEMSTKKEWLLSWSLTHGLSYVSEKYDTFTKPINYAIGSYINFLAQLKIKSYFGLKSKLRFKLKIGS